MLTPPGARDSAALAAPADPEAADVRFRHQDIATGKEALPLWQNYTLARLEETKRNSSNVRKYKA